VFPDPNEHPLLWMESALSIPAPLARRWTRRYGEERTRALALAALSEPDLSVRAIEPRESVAGALDQLGCPSRNGAHAAILLVASEHTELALGSELFARGAFQIQGETALRSAELLGARAGERLLDGCAAPGGKTAVLAATGARVLACDSSFDRLLRVRTGLARLAPAGAVELAVCDAVSALAERAFDGVLADVPCSNTGVLAQRPEARWRFGPAASRSLQELQERILREAAARVRPGGRLVYSTCSLEPDENGRRVATFLAKHADFALEEEIEALPDPAGAAGPVDGGYAARLRRS